MGRNAPLPVDFVTSGIFQLNLTGIEILIDILFFFSKFEQVFAASALIHKFYS